MNTPIGIQEINAIYNNNFILQEEEVKTGRLGVIVKSSFNIQPLRGCWLKVYLIPQLYWGSLTFNPFGVIVCWLYITYIPQ